MSHDPNGTRWTNSDSNYGKSLLKRSGWTEGSGLGRNQEGTTSHVKTKRKDDVMGIGYEGGVQETWSTQSVGFADVLSRIQQSVAAKTSSESGSEGDGNDTKNDDDGQKRQSGPSGSRHVGMYAKRHALKTELLRRKDTKSSDEILGSASSSRKHARGRGADDEDDGVQSTLKSPVLQRIMQRRPDHEPKPTVTRNADDAASEVETVRVTKPNPRPPKCTDTPFLVA